MYAGFSTLPGKGVSPDAVVLHDRAERDQYADQWMFGQPGRRTMSEFIRGTLCSIELPAEGRERGGAAILAALAPACNARFIKYFGACGSDDADAAGKAEPFVADHHFERLCPPAETDWDDPVRTIYAHCKGCVELGYHLPSTDISCAAFGTPAPPPRPYVDVAGKERLAKMTPEEKVARDAEQARLRAQLEENRQKLKPKMDAMRDEWRRKHA